MKNLLFNLFFFMQLAAGLAQSVELKFKFNETKPTVYKVTMNAEHPDSVQFSMPMFGKLFSSMLPDSLKGIASAAEKISSDSSQNDTTHSVEKGLQSFIQTLMGDKEENPDYFVINSIEKDKFLISYTNGDTTFNLMNQTHFNALMDNRGNNLSFYHSEGVNDIMRIFFYLPEGKVKVGDTWKLGLDLTAFRGYVSCDTSYKKDIVKVISMEKTGNDILVTLSYDFEEFFKGYFFMATESRMKYTGTAVFSTKNGEWIKYDCMKEAKMTGFSDSWSKMIYRLEPVASYPENLMWQTRKDPLFKKRK